MTDIALTTLVEIYYRGKNITADISPDLITFSFTDNEHGQADDISLTLKNDHGRWTNEWLPTLGDKIQASIIQVGRDAQSPLKCGTFTLDEFETSFTESSIVTFKAVSVPSETSVRKTEKSKGWEKVKLSEIASDIAKNGNLTLTYATDIDPVFDRKDQRNTPDLKFLKQVCEDEALNLKVTDSQLVIFDPQEMDKKPSELTFTLGTDKILSFTTRFQNHSTASEATVKYSDPKTGKIEEHTEKSDKIKDNKPIKKVERASSKAEAERKAKAKLYNENKSESTANLVVVGNTSLVAGICIDVNGYGKCGGKFKITKVTHDVTNGYTSSMELERK